VPIKITTKGLIELWRGSVKVSGHSIETEAVERATADAEASGATLYVLKYPSKEIDLSRLTRVVRDIDVTRPTTPAGLAATPVSETAINLSWSAATDPQGAVTEAVTGIAGYKIYRDAVLRATEAGLTFSDTGLSAYTVYSYRITAYDNAGNESFQSTAITPRTLDTTAPTAPTLSASATSSTVIVVSRTVASTDAGSGVSTYALERSPNGSTGWSVLSSTATFPFSDTGLTAGTQYFYRSRATDVSLNVGAYSAVVNATTTVVNQAPVWQSSVNQAPVLNVAYSLNLDTLCSDPESQPLTYTITSGTLPTGLTQSGVRGQIISGTPTSASSFVVTFRANDLGA
jgi:hypothetical protein